MGLFLLCKWSENASTVKVLLIKKKEVLYEIREKFEN